VKRMDVVKKGDSWVGEISVLASLSAEGKSCEAPPAQSFAATRGVRSVYREGARIAEHSRPGVVGRR
jgi:hypothetical protein